MPKTKLSNSSLDAVNYRTNRTPHIDCESVEELCSITSGRACPPLKRHLASRNSYSRDFLRDENRRDTGHCWQTGCLASGFLRRMIQKSDLYKGTGADLNPEVLSISLMVVGWLEAQFRSSADTPPSVRNDQRRGQQRMQLGAGGSICHARWSATCSQ